MRMPATKIKITLLNCRIPGPLNTVSNIKKKLPPQSRSRPIYIINSDINCGTAGALVYLVLHYSYLTSTVGALRDWGSTTVVVYLLAESKISRTSCWKNTSHLIAIIFDSELNKF